MRAGRIAALGLLLVGCGGTARRDHENPTNLQPPDASGGAGGAVAEPTRCGLPAPALVRLTFDEVLQSARALLGDELADAMAAERGEPPLASFPPLASPGEGIAFTDATLRTSDRLAQVAGRYVREHFELTECATDDFECVSSYVATLGERAFRRPLSERDRLALLRPVEQAEALGVDASFGAEYGVYAIFESPHFLYRSELGEASSDLAAGERRLSDHELGSALAFLLTGGPPDQELLAAARAGALTSGEELEAQVSRLLDAPVGRRHLERQLAAFLQFDRLDTQVIDPSVEPTPFTPELRLGMRSELDALLANELWAGGVGSLLTSRRARVNSSLAEVYGIEFPPPGASVDAEGFAEAELPETRAGLLTRAGWATLTSRPDGPTVIGRGLRVMSLLCEPQPEFPDLDAAVQSPPDQHALTARERAEYRMTTAPCDSCHANIDPFGLALEDLGTLGSFRSADAEGRPIDASATLPAFAGGARVDGALELSQAIPEELFARCLSQSFLSYAQSTLGVIDTCERDALAEARAETGDQSFGNIVRQVVLSRSFRLRKP